MQYILTQEEFDRLKARPTEIIEAKDAVIQRLCTEMADRVPIKPDWYSKDDAPEPWGCIITAEKEGDYNHYCDECPARIPCPYPRKEFSK